MQIFQFVRQFQNATRNVSAPTEAYFYYQDFFNYQLTSQKQVLKLKKNVYALVFAGQ